MTRRQRSPSITVRGGQVITIDQPVQSEPPVEAPPAMAEDPPEAPSTAEPDNQPAPAAPTTKPEE